MKKTAIAIAVALAGFATIAQAAPKDNTWYTGGKLGWSRYLAKGEEGNGYVNNDGPSHENQIGAGAYVGYQINQYVGAEAGYDWLGRMPNKGHIVNGAFRAHLIQLTARASYPITDALDIYARGGGAVWFADATQRNTITGTHISDHDTGVSPLVAGGLEYALTRNWATRLEYQWVNNIGDSKTVGSRPDNQMVSVGVAYRFGQDVAAPPPAPVPAPAPVVSTKHIQLRSDVLFNFNKSTLKPEGQQALNDLYSQVSSIDPKDGSVLVVGYTDRIGSEAYNLKLSEARAQSVVDYLVSKGIPADKISAKGMGKADPVTGNTCNGVKGRKALISCLAPDRRVEIEIAGVKEIVTQPQD